jgi:hypothetical protein
MEPVDNTVAPLPDVVPVTLMVLEVPAQSVSVRVAPPAEAALIIFSTVICDDCGIALLPVLAIRSDGNRNQDRASRHADRQHQARYHQLDQRHSALPAVPVFSL